MCFNPKFATFSYYYNNDLKRVVKDITFVHRPPDEYIKNSDYAKNYIVIPCRKCLACRIDQANSWSVRCLLEAKKWKQNCFLTLTYDDEHLHRVGNRGTLYKKDVQDFFKNLRYHYCRNHEDPIRYFAVGEYGSMKYTMRPHYHLGVFNFMPDDLKFYKLSKTGYPMYNSDKLHKIWNKGYVVVMFMTYETACYIARYTQKKINKSYDKICTDLGLAKEFKLTSRRPGLALDVVYNEEEWNNIKRNFGVLIKTNNGVKLKGIPEPLKQRWREIDEIEYYKLADARHDSKVEQQVQVLNNTSLSYKDYLIQQSKLCEDRLKRLKRLDM